MAFFLALPDPRDCRICPAKPGNSSREYLNLTTEPAHSYKICANLLRPRHARIWLVPLPVVVRLQALVSLSLLCHIPESDSMLCGAVTCISFRTKPSPLSTS